MIPTTITLLFLALTLTALRIDSKPLLWLSKPTASVGFLALAWTAGCFATPFGQAIFAALFLSFIGDVALMGRGQLAFLAGLVAFLLAHVLFCVAFVIYGIDATASGVGAVAVAVVAIPVTRWLLPKVPDKLKRPVIAYIAVISVMVSLAAGCWPGTLATQLIVAAVVFFASDLSVAIDRFAGGGFFNKLWGLPAYYGAQLLFAAASGAT